MNESEYLSFQLVTPDDGRPTLEWYVISRRHGFSLGRIKWHGAWRQYAFFPDAGTLFDRKCLSAIGAFLEERMEKRRKGESA